MWKLTEGMANKNEFKMYLSYFEGRGFNLPEIIRNIEKMFLLM